MTTYNVCQSFAILLRILSHSADPATGDTLAGAIKRTGKISMRYVGPEWSFLGIIKVCACSFFPSRSRYIILTASRAGYLRENL